MRSVTTFLAIAATLVVGEIAGAAAFPARIDLPDGFRPEGIAAGRGATLYVGSIPTGAVRRIDARTGATTEVVPAHEGRAAIGLKLERGARRDRGHRRGHRARASHHGRDNRRDRLFVSGGPTGKAFVYDARSGADLAQIQLAPAGAETFVNDVALTGRAAYFTDSRRAVLYVVDENLRRARELGLPGFPLAAGNNLNGIAAAGKRTLLAIQSNTGALWRIDAKTGANEKVDLGGATLENGDGLLLEGNTLYVVQNRLNQIAVVTLSKDWRSGNVGATPITSDGFDVPTTIARLGDRFYLPNARFTTPPEPDTDYWVTAVPAP
jgi:hypothetical protein